jgi:prepilin-type N-terminal cleavage/methylation domain-containing protein
MERNRRTDGFTILEMMICVLILGIIALGLERVLATTLSSSTAISGTQDVLIQARLAMERMVMFAQETDQIANPTTSNEEILKVSERLLDTYNNKTHVYIAGGDGMIDADTSADGVVNPGANYITYTLDKTVSGNWKLMEQMPDYSTAPSGLLPAKVICQYVTEFHCTRFSSNLVLIVLTVNSGQTGVTLQTRVRARLLD